MRQLWIIVLVTGCSERSQIAIDYQLGNIDLTTLVRVETYVAVAPGDTRSFFADQPYRSVAEGVGYEVRDFDGMGQRKVLITHDATLGFTFAPSFVFTVLPPPSEAAPQLLVLARAVGASTMLGRTDELPAHFAVGARLKVTLSDQRCAGVACASDQACCSDQCTNTLSDAKSCGACGMACAPVGDSCQGGSCLCAGGSACSGGKTCCERIGCVDLASDPYNCGSCGKACSPGETCSAGACSCNGGAACGAGGLCCAGTGCSSIGSCPCGVSACSSPNVCCDATQGVCVNLMTNNNSCGTCGTACATGLSCQNGACTCSGQICSMSDTCCSTGCANLQGSTTNCGTCGHACAVNEACSGGVCKCGSSSCAMGQTCCGQSCKSLQSDNMNCGACGKACNAGEQCVSGQCRCPGTQPPRGCSPGETCCSGTTGAGCFDLSNNQSHCGSCTTPCTTGQQCMTGTCHQTSCSPACTNGNSCDPNSFTCKCGSGNACSGNQSCCSGSCVDKLSDPQNCGQCGNDVNPNLCCNGRSTAVDENNCGGCDKLCTFDQLCCPGDHVYLCVNNDQDNCGGCGNTCPSPKDPSDKFCCTCGRQGSCSSLLCPLDGCLPPPPTGGGGGL